MAVIRGTLRTQFRLCAFSWLLRDNVIIIAIIDLIYCTTSASMSVLLALLSTGLVPRDAVERNKSSLSSLSSVSGTIMLERTIHCMIFEHT
jgi:hypothetical protein